MSQGYCARSCLSEMIKFDENRLEAKTLKESTSPSPTAQRNCISEVGWELNQIFSSQNTNEHSIVFGCTPPLRASNPLCRDYHFQNCLSGHNHHRDEANKTVEFYNFLIPDL